MATPAGTNSRLLPQLPGLSSRPPHPPGDMASIPEPSLGGISSSPAPALPAPVPTVPSSSDAQAPPVTSPLTEQTMSQLIQVSPSPGSQSPQTPVTSANSSLASLETRAQRHEARAQALRASAETRSPTPIPSRRVHFQEQPTVPVFPRHFPAPSFNQGISSHALEDFDMGEGEVDMAAVSAYMDAMEAEDALDPIQFTQPNQVDPATPTVQPPVIQPLPAWSQPMETPNLLRGGPTSTSGRPYPSFGPLTDAQRTLAAYARFQEARRRMLANRRQNARTAQAAVHAHATTLPTGPFPGVPVQPPVLLPIQPQIQHPTTPVLHPAPSRMPAMSTVQPQQVISSTSRFSSGVDGPKVKLQPPLKYSGTDSSVKTHRWTRQMEKYLQMCRIPLDQYVDYAEAYLQGLALSVWQSAAQGKTGNDLLVMRHWTTFVTVLHARFDDPNASQARRRAFSNSRYTGDWTYQSMRAFCNQVLEDVAEIAQPDLQGMSHPLDDRSAISSFLAKLPGAFGQELAARVQLHPSPPSTLDQAIQMVLHHLALLPGRPQPPVQPEDFQPAKKQRAHFNWDHSTSTSQPGGRSPVLPLKAVQSMPATPAQNPGQPPRYSRPPIQPSADGIVRDLRVLAMGEGARRKVAGVCMWCNHPGHKLFQCTVVQPAGPLYGEGASAKGKSQVLGQ